MYTKSIIAIALLFQLSAQAAPKMIRWTATEDADASFAHVLDVISQKTGYRFTDANFILQDNRDLAFNHYARYEQLKSGDAIDGRAIRLWTDLKTGKLIQAEAYLNVPSAEEKADGERMVLQKERLGDGETMKFALQAIRNTRNVNFRAIEWKDRWLDGQFVRIVTVKGKRGETQVIVHHRTKKILNSKFEEYPQADLSRVETSLNALVYPIYEETEDGSQRLQRVPVSLDHLLANVPNVEGDIYAPLKTRRYLYEQYSPVRGMTEAGRAKGYWAMSYLKEQAAAIRANLPLVSNDFNRGMLLQGNYATINIHPDAFTKFQGIDFTPVTSASLLPTWKPVGESYEILLGTAYYGKALKSADEAMGRVATRLADHNPVQYINDGFDEIQVYYAINKLFDMLHANGFSDPELSTRAFNAFLFNPDIEYRDNAFYTDDTINFTTYSPKAQNYARDNSTIWHELGHGVMDRLMGDNITLIDSGGLAEGMADFVAALVIQGATNGVPFAGSTQFRIINQTGFSLTNESHDDGEAYGGAMKDLMDAVVKSDSQNGLNKVTDVILEAMRLTRDHPALDANEWFSHVLFADSLGREGLRAPNELREIIIAALNGRNFRMDGGAVAELNLYNDQTGKPVTATSVGSRYNQIQLTLKKDETKELAMKVALKSSANYQFKYPVTVKVEFHKGALQGAVHWVGEENSPMMFTLNSEADALKIPLTVTGTCDEINREDGSCSDYAYVQVFNQGDTTGHPNAKKRFYVQIRNP